MQPLTAKTGDNLVVTYNKSPHVLYLGNSPGDKSLGIVAPRAAGGSVHTIPLTKPGAALLMICRQ